MFAYAISKTTDGGATWTTVTTDDTSTVYLNGIDCVSADNCIAAGEGDASSFLLSTNDGGKTWEKRP